MLIYNSDECAKCHSCNLKYSTPYVDDNTMIHEYECEDCHAKGQEVYDLLFSYNEAE